MMSIPDPLIADSEGLPEFGDSKFPSGEAFNMAVSATRLAIQAIAADPALGGEVRSILEEVDKLFQASGRAD